VSDTAAYRTHNAWRRLGYSLLPGDGFSYLLHLRPAEWPIMAAHTIVGFLLATKLAFALDRAWLGNGLLALVIWVLFLNGGTLAINSAFDKDEGDIGYLDKPPPPPRHLFAFSLLLMAAGQGLAFLLPAGFTVAYAICFAMSLAYSVPPLRLKAVGGVDWIINMVGFGTLTPYAGFAATGRALDLPAALVLIAFTPLFAALYPLTQLYQFEEDSRRGDRTLALILGMENSLRIAVGAAVAAFGFFGWAAWLRGINGWQLLGLAVAFAAWLRVLLPWLRRWAAMSPEQHKRGMYAALAAWAVTDVAVLAAFAL
jgi:lycopene elongase/hydratase (dihydrobisanhydrobacterioruberin-forming)